MTSNHINELKGKCVLVTGAAGFIGYHVCKALLQLGVRVVGIDNYSPYYSPDLKKRRIDLLQTRDFDFHQMDICEKDRLHELFARGDFEYVVHLAAQAGVRYSVENPQIYIDSNVTGFQNILDVCTSAKVKHLVYASSSSVYGGLKQIPYRISDRVDHPKSTYAATKKMNELMAHTYASLHGLPVTGLRFFTVYGPYYRPDMALYKFMDRMRRGDPIQVYNNGDMYRGFTYVDDVVDAVVNLLDHAPEGDRSWDEASSLPSHSWAPYALHNVGSEKPENLMHVIELLEKFSGLKAEKEFLPMQPGDLEKTAADCSSLREAVGYSPTTSLEQGLPRFVNWYLDYHQ